MKAWLENVASETVFYVKEKEDATAVKVLMLPSYVLCSSCDTYASYVRQPAKVSTLTFLGNKT